MVSLRYLSPLVLALCLAARPGHAQQADLTPLAPVQPQLRWPDVPARGVAVPTGTEVAVAKRCRSSVPPPSRVLVLLNSQLIASLGGLGDFNPNDIENVTVYKGGGPINPTSAQWRGLDANGLIAIKLKKHVKVRLESQTLAQLGCYLQAQGLVSYTINGLPTTNGSLRIATSSIEEIKLTRTAAGTTVGVWLREEPSQPTQAYPPGTIMLRGTASL